VNDREQGHHASCRINRVRLRGKEVDVAVGRSVSSEADQLKSRPEARVHRARDLHKPLPATSQIGARIEPELALVMRERHAPIELARTRRHSDRRQVASLNASGLPAFKCDVRSDPRALDATVPLDGQETVLRAQPETTSRRGIAYDGPFTAVRIVAPCLGRREPNAELLLGHILMRTVPDEGGNQPDEGGNQHAAHSHADGT
jgi:hypothetical protein